MAQHLYYNCNIDNCNLFRQAGALKLVSLVWLQKSPAHPSCEAELIYYSSVLWAKLLLLVMVESNEIIRYEIEVYCSKITTRRFRCATTNYGIHDPGISRCSVFLE